MNNTNNNLELYKKYNVLLIILKMKEKTIVFY